MMEVRQGSPFLRVEFVNEFGDRHEVSYDLFDSSVDSIISSQLNSLLAFGFMEQSINEALVGICEDRELLNDYGSEDFEKGEL